jgi:hypothetical protein
MSLHPQLEQLIDTMLPFVKEFHGNLQLAPHAASMTVSGEVLGSALVIDEGRENISVEYAIEHFEKEYRESATQGKIIASAIFFHGIEAQKGIFPATSISEAANLIVALEHHSGQSIYLAIPYHASSNGFTYEMGKLIEKQPAVFLRKSKRVNKSWWRFW